MRLTNIFFAAGLATEAGADSQQAVLVTGASTGIGRKITEVLAGRGYFVYAGARKQQDLDALNALDNVQAMRLDVTIPPLIIESQGRITTIGQLIKELVQLNDGQPYEYSRDGLVAMLDAAMGVSQQEPR